MKSHFLIVSCAAQPRNHGYQKILVPQQGGWGMGFQRLGYAGAGLSITKLTVIFDATEAEVKAAIQFAAKSLDNAPSYC